MATNRRDTLKEQMDKMAEKDKENSQKRLEKEQSRSGQKNNSGPSIAQKNRTYDLRLKEKEIQELKGQIKKLEKNSFNPVVVEDLKIR